MIPPLILDVYDLHRFVTNGTLYASVHKTHYGLPQVGALSQQRLYSHLREHGYIKLRHAPSCFRNKKGTVRFCLVVDDFAVAWNSKTDMDHLVFTLQQLYQVKVNWAGNKYLGMDIDIDRTERHVTISMPGYVAKLLQRVKPHGIKGASTPGIYTPPNYANPTSQRATVDLSTRASEPQKRLLQSVVGTLLYYSRAVDPSILTAVLELGSTQSQPTEKDMDKMNRLLQYVSAHPHNAIRYYASDMVLQLMSDASFLSRPKARSVAGLSSYFGQPHMINGPVTYASKIINSMVASVAEAELAAAFLAAQKATQHRNLLAEWGYPQPPTLLRVDNTVALGLANGRINAKRSKSMDMRFFWLIDRVQQGQFCVAHIAGKFNFSDHFTKTLPKQIFSMFFPFLTINLDNELTKPKSKTKTITMPKL
jgi:hypothetical protein